MRGTISLRLTYTEDLEHMSSPDILIMDSYENNISQPSVFHFGKDIPSKYILRVNSLHVRPDVIPYTCKILSESLILHRYVSPS
jgi:hypothetical protein